MAKITSINVAPMGPAHFWVTTEPADAVVTWGGDIGVNPHYSPDSHHLHTSYDTEGYKVLWAEIPSSGDKEWIYVEVFLHGGGGGGGGQCPAIDVKPADPLTHKIKSTIHDGMDHFVAVAGPNNTHLKAIIKPNKKEIRDALTWEADGAPIVSPWIGQDRLTARILTANSNSPMPKKIKVTIKVKGAICKQFMVWIIWCKLTGKTAGTPTLTNQPLGILNHRVDPPGFHHYYNPNAKIEWTATIQPREIITDADRPNIEGQTRVAPPGHIVDKFHNPDKGVPSPGNKDTTYRDRKSVV